MKLLEKLKNTFFEEEYVEVPEKPKKEVEKKPEVKKEVKKPQVTINRNDIEEEIPVKEEIKKEVPIKREAPKVVEQPKKPAPTFSYFDDDDFLDMDDIPPKKEEVKPQIRREEPVKKVYDNPVYGTNKIQTKAPSPYVKENASKAFKPTPIISPIYGILDKNYTKDEIVDKKEVKQPSSFASVKNNDLDSVREKAFGTNLQSDFELEDDFVEPVTIKEEIEDDLLFDMTEVDKTPSVDKVTLQDAEEYFSELGLEYNIDYKDSKQEKVTGRRVAKSKKIEEEFDDDLTSMDDFAEPVIEEKSIEEEIENSFVDDEEETIDSFEDDFDEISVDEDIEEDSNSFDEQDDGLSLEDNLFDLIDSMYEDKE